MSDSRVFRAAISNMVYAAETPHKWQEMTRTEVMICTAIASVFHDLKISSYQRYNWHFVGDMDYDELIAAFDMAREEAKKHVRSNGDRWLVYKKYFGEDIARELCA